MNINDLKNGMCLVLRNNGRRYIIDDEVYYKACDGLLKFDWTLVGMKNSYSLNMMYGDVETGLDIMKVIDVDGKIIYERDKTDWTKVPVDTKVWVKNSKNDEWLPRYFVRYDLGNTNTPFVTFIGGCTKWSSRNDIYYWKYCKLAEEEE